MKQKHDRTSPIGTTRVGDLWPQKEGEAMFQILIYPITAELWRWEIFCGRALIRCGAAKTLVAAENEVNEAANALQGVSSRES
jgi:hypothetical protein